MSNSFPSGDEFRRLPMPTGNGWNIKLVLKGLLLGLHWGADCNCCARQ